MTPSDVNHIAWKQTKLSFDFYYYMTTTFIAIQLAISDRVADSATTT
jgi:hypothetical protein